MKLAGNTISNPRACRHRNDSLVCYYNNASIFEFENDTRKIIFPKNSFYKSTEYLLTATITKDARQPREYSFVIVFADVGLSILRFDFQPIYSHLTYFENGREARLRSHLIAPNLGDGKWLTWIRDSFPNVQLNSPDLTIETSVDNYETELIHLQSNMAVGIF